MFIGTLRPPDITWTISATGPGNTGQSIVSGASNLIDGRPDSTCRIQWPTGASQTTSTVLHLKGDWLATPISPRLVGLSNISLPVGTKVSVAFRRSSDTLGTYPYTPTMYNNNQRIVAGPRGERTVWILLPSGATGTVLGVDIQIANDVNGSVGNSAGLGPFNTGEAVVCGGVDPDIEPGWDQYETDPTTRNFSWQKQPYSVPGCVFRQLDFSFRTDEQKVYFGDSANLSAFDVQEICAMIDRGQSAVYIARYVDATNTFDAQMLHRMAFIGVATQLPKISQKGGTYMASGSVQVTEAPVPT